MDAKTRTGLLWEEFLAQEPTNDNLCEVIRDVEPLSELAGQLLLDRQPSKNFGEEMGLIMKKVMSLKEKAAEKLLAHETDNLYLCLIIKCVESLRERAWQKLLKQQPSDNDLVDIIIDIESLRERAWQELQEYEDIDEWVLYRIIVKVLPLREQAWKKLKELDPSNHILYRIIENVGSLKKEAQMLLDRTIKEIIVEMKQLPF